MDRERYIFIVLVGTAFILSMIGIVGFLMVVNTNRRHRHRAELAEADLRRESEVMQAEREATEQTLNEIGRELHDSVGQLLTVAQMGFLNRLDPALLEEAPVATAMGALDEGIEEVRRLGRSLNSDLWQERDLVDALEAEAVRIAWRPQQRPASILEFEIPASAYWNGQTFAANYFVDIRDTLDRKLAALSAYTTEAKAAPHPRSPEGVAHLAHHHGGHVVTRAAEAFRVLRGFEGQLP